MLKFPKSCTVVIILFLILVIFTPQLYYSSLTTNKTDTLRVSSGFQWNSTLLNSGDDEARDLVLDQNGDIIITGKIYNSSKNADDIAIIKYDTSGNIEWNKTWGGSADDSGLSVAIDSSNNIYVTGYANSSGSGSYDICLLKYSSSGILIWNKTWGGVNADKGYGVDIDDYGNVYVGGYTNVLNGYDDVILLKYDTTTGTLLNNITWGGFYDERALDLILDTSGNIYLTGYTDNFGAIVRDMFLVKYNTSGDLVFNTTFGDDRWHEGRSLLLDSSENILITGFIQNFGSGGDLLLFKFNSSTGAVEWSTYWGGNEHDYAYRAALDSKENIYLVGSTESYEGPHKKACIVKFNNTGNYEWIKTFSNDLEDVAYGIAADPFDNFYITGKTNLNETNYDIFLNNYYPVPWTFTLSSDATSPEIDGSFNLIWTESLDAKNYSLYQSNESINLINENVTKIVSGNTNRTYSIINLEEGTYFFKVFAYNEYGNTSSTQISVIVDYSPANFELYIILPEINTDGRISISWGESIGAVNYSVYVNNSYISNYENKGALIIDGLTELTYSIPGILSDDIYYFVVIAYNSAGETISNCVNVTVQKLPLFFTLSEEIEPQNYDEDGEFFLVWAKSNYSQYYIIYRSTTNITDIHDDSVSVVDTYTPDFEWPEYRFPVSVSQSGVYYFLVVAINANGNYSTECIEIEVRIPETPIMPPDSPLLLLLILIPIFSVVGVIAIIFYLRLKRKKKSEEIVNGE